VLAVTPLFRRLAYLTNEPLIALASATARIRFLDVASTVMTVLF
jgi:hypothetical protein